ncbi:SagB family peptide dehydrogenase [bacterium]|nr:SagB family peptide dehydrogenase [bacterium]
MTSIAEYHERSKHSPASVRASRHTLDWAIQPLPFKIYEDAPALPLPRDLGASARPALSALAAPGGGEVATPDLRHLARLLHLSAGITRRRTYPGGQVMDFRAAACTGALYHIDVYVACGALPGLAAGVYQFGPHDGALHQLRRGDFRAVLAEASGGEPAVAAAPALLVCASTFWRNAWKYQARTYRHCFWDAGTLLANLLAVAAADGVPARVVVGFADAAVNALLGLDGAREVALSLVALGRGAPPPPAPAVPTLRLATRPLSAREVDYPLIRAAHAATSLADATAVRAWRTRLAALAPRPAAAGMGEPVPLPAPAPAPARPIDEVIRRRGSARRFARAPIAFDALAAMLRAASGGIPFDDGSDGMALVEPHLIVHAVTDLPPGTYAFDRRAPALTPLSRGDLRAVAGHLDLGQALAAEAAVNVYCLADLPRLLDAGDRSYRAAALAAAIAGGKLYLATYALGLGATGLTFFDDDVIELFSPHAAGKAVMFLVAAGPPAPRL